MSFKHLGHAAQKFALCTEVRTMTHKSSHLASHRSSHFARLSTTKVRTLPCFQHKSSHFALAKSLIYIGFLTTERLAGLLKGLLATQSLSFPEHGVRIRCMELEKPTVRSAETSRRNGDGPVQLNRKVRTFVQAPCREPGVPSTRCELLCQDRWCGLMQGSVGRHRRLRQDKRTPCRTRPRLSCASGTPHSTKA